MLRPATALIVFVALFSLARLQAQSRLPPPDHLHGMPDGMQMSDAEMQSMETPGQSMLGMPMGGPASTLTENILRHTASGTSLDPSSAAPPMLMQMRGNWMLMLHGQVSIAEQQQTGPRGGDKLFADNWIMPMAMRSYPHGQLTLRTMLSLEPATISGRYFPELFQQGETAFGKPILDGQHPHNFFMEIAGLYDQKLSKNTLLSLYVAPVGDPALGPVAFPHRTSAAENPLAPLGHHLQDSTHIADEVLTASLTLHHLRIEASGFHGREPDENRWHIQLGSPDSWATRLTLAPVRDLIVQYSIGHLHSPEALHPTENVLRQTASIAYHHTWPANSGKAITLDALALWGRNHSIASPTNSNGYLFEATAHLFAPCTNHANAEGVDLVGTCQGSARHSLWTRLENVDRTTDLLGPTAPDEETVIGRAQAYTAGYAHHLYSNHWSTAELGAQATLYTTPTPLQTQYGNHPKGLAIVLNLHLGK